MNIKEFGKEMEKHVGEALGTGYGVKYTEVLKNNGVMYHALSIRKGDQNVAPTIYIDMLFEHYNRGCLMNTLVKEVVKMYRLSSPKNDVGIEFYYDFSQVADNLFFKAVNYEKNIDKLKDVPYKRALDLALVPLCRYKNVEIGSGVITVLNSHLKMWEISKDELWENVIESAVKNEPVKMTGILDVLEKVTGKSCSVDEMGEMSDAFGMYVLSNESGMYGAGTIFYPDALKKIADNMETDLFIIPSSVHEVLIIPDSNYDMDVEELRAMIREVNETTVKDEEVLSDNLYVYDRDSDRILSVGGNAQEAYA